MARPAHIPNCLRHGPFRGSEAVGRDLITKRQLDSGAWQRPFHDVYVHERIALTHRVRCQAVALLLPPGAAISGGSAALLSGADVLGPDAPVEVTVPPHLRMRRRPGIAVRYSELCASDVLSVAGVRITTPVRTGFDLARRNKVDDAVVGVDALLMRCDVTVDQISAYANDGRTAWRGISRLWKVLSLARRGAESPMETRLRLLLIRAGLPAPLLQHPVCDDSGAFVARLDLAYPDARLGIEYDGELHWNPKAVRKDLLRQNALRASSWSLLRFTADDVLRHPRRLAAQVRSALRS
ncbi:MAG TPA: DUF559 domain-containing protein [Candidatus Dormibacteraeota bacterium]|nr:DUF559 domain-containing protein [Candidatus Dormibacteraeota bacterium]